MAASAGFNGDVHLHVGPDPVGPFRMFPAEGFLSGRLRDGTSVFKHGFEPEFGRLFGVGVRLFERVARGITAGQVRDNDAEGLGFVAGFDGDGPKLG